ncbi:MAG: hypothetical protein OEY34_07870 [Cyclobacteriaceae bacterium]|nr:hypothetical protein [Cyclobacteriaceae bacterium]
MIIPEPDPGNIVINVSDPQFSDPYYYTARTKVTFSFSGYNGKIVSAIVKNGSEKLFVSVSSNSFDLDLNNNVLYEGSNNINMEVVLSSGTGSLADKSGAENFVFRGSFNVIVDPSVPPDVNITPTFEKGYLELKWDTITQSNFKYLLRISGTEYSVYETRENNFAHYTDIGYFGGYYTFQLYAVGYKFEKLLGKVTINRNPLTSIDYIQRGDSLFAKFNVLEPIGNDVKVTLKSNYTYLENKVLDFSYEPQFISNLEPGKYINYYVNMHRNGYESRGTITYFHYIEPPKLPVFNKGKIIPGQDKILLYINNYLHRYSLIDYKLEESFGPIDTYRYDRVFLLSPSGKYCILANNKIRYKINPLNFSEVEEFTVEEKLVPLDPSGPLYHREELGNINDLGQLTFTARDYEMVYSGIYDVNSKSVIWYDSYSSLEWNKNQIPYISNDGNRLSMFDERVNLLRIYSQEGQNYVFSGNLSNRENIKWIGSNEVISEVLDDDFFTIWDLRTPPDNLEMSYTNSTKIYGSSFATEGYPFYRIHFEPNRNEVNIIYGSYFSDKKLIRYSLDTREVIDVLTVYDTYSSHSFEEGYQFDLNGYIYKKW